ncbi:DNA modification methylase [Patescibacteria group bacterium]|nr:DNA modification methylase [Patescibacteria group bacterium]
MTIEDLITIYETKKKKFGDQVYRHISDVFIEAKPQHKADFKGKDHEQSWRAFKGKNLEKLIEHIIVDEVEELGLEVVNGNSLERSKGKKLSEKLSKVKRNLLIDYGEFGSHLPDVDIIIFNPKTSDVVAVFSSKVTLRERITQTGYWKLKLSDDEATKHIKVYFVTPDEDGTLTSKSPAKKGRAIVEVDTDGSYILSKADIEVSDKVKMFDQFIDDLKKIYL